MNCLYRIDQTDYLLLAPMLGNPNDTKHALEFYCADGQRQLQFLGRYQFSEAQLEALRIESLALESVTHLSASDEYLLLCAEQLKHGNFTMFTDRIYGQDILYEYSSEPENEYHFLSSKCFNRFCYKTYTNKEILKLCLVDYEMTSQSCFQVSSKEGERGNPLKDLTIAAFYKERHGIDLRRDSYIALCTSNINEQTPKFANYTEYAAYLKVCKRYHFQQIPLELLELFEHQIPDPPNLQELSECLRAMFECNANMMRLGLTSSTTHNFWRWYDAIQRTPIQRFPIMKQGGVMFQRVYQRTKSQDMLSYIIDANEEYLRYLSHPLEDTAFLKSEFSMTQRISTERQRMEFLGDAVLGYLMTEKITACGKKYMRYKARLVSNGYMATIFTAHAELLSEVIEPQGETEKPMGDAFECLFAFLYMTKGLQFCDALLARLITLEDGLRSAITAEERVLTAELMVKVKQIYQESHELLANTQFDIEADEEELRAIWFAAAYVDDMPNSIAGFMRRENSVKLEKSKKIAHNIIAAMRINECVPDEMHYDLELNLRHIFIRPCEALEMLGDAFLKLVLTLSLFLLHPSMNEGFMSILRRSLENNEHLRQTLLNEIPFAALHIFESVQCGVHSKLFGDLFEQIVGAVLLATGPEAAAVFIREILPITDELLDGRYNDLIQILAEHNHIRVQCRMYKGKMAYHFDDTPVLRADATLASVFRLLCHLCAEDSPSQHLRNEPSSWTE